MNKLIKIDLEQMRQTLLVFLQKHWRLFLMEGVFFIILGILAVLTPHFFTIGITLFLGWLLLIGGVFQLIRAISIFDMPGFSLWILIGILQTAIGYYLVAEPTKGSLTLTLVMTVFFAMEGLAKIYLALLMRPLEHWGRVLFSGVTALILAIVVWAGWPTTGLWVLGLLLGINMILLGWALVRISLHYRPVS